MYIDNKWLVVLVATVGLVGMATGCGPEYPKCNTSEDCRKSEKGQEQGKLYCVNGRCQECREDGDCDTGEQCSGGACQPIPGYCEGDADCSGSQVCRDNRCGPECRSDDECSEGQVCEGGECVADQECTTNADCASNETCQDGECIVQTSTECSLETVYFPFDSSELSSDARDKLQDNADCIEQKENRTVELAGHCDERGTNEYNIALGRRRAQSAYDYLESLGVSSNRLETISYGEERLARQCGVDGPDSCHKWNRRVEFNFQ